ncbi:MAG: hypothetical protein A2Y29_16685 [Spirochaetes bacterium GWE2_31_10]|nr:MAG: hypothetical protein A2Y29_16685 [Spirochaetes bacterium GWE2_31_10]
MKSIKPRDILIDFFIIIIFFSIYIVLRFLVSPVFLKFVILLYIISISNTVFYVIWHTRKHSENHYLTGLSVGFLFIGISNIVYLTSILEFNRIVSFESAFFILNFIQSTTILFFTVTAGRRKNINYSGMFINYLITFIVLIYITTFFSNRCMYFSAYLFILIYIIAIFILILRKDSFNRMFIHCNVKSILLNIIFLVMYCINITKNETIYTISLVVYSLSFYFIYKAIIIKSLSEPIDLIYNKLLESEIKYKSIFNNSFIGIADINLHGNFILVNKSFQSFIGYSNEELINMRLDDIIYADDIFIINDTLQKISNNTNDNVNIELKLINKQNEPVNTELYICANRNNDNKIESIIIVFNDVTEKIKLDIQIKKLHMAIEQAANTIVITDFDGFIEYVNPQFSIQTGYSFTEALGKNPNILKTDFHDSSYYKTLWDTIKSGKSWSGTFYNKKKNGELYWELCTINPVFDSFGTIINFIAVKEDITALKKIETELKESNAAKDKFFSIIAHDLKNPFNGILGLTNVILTHKELSQESIYSNIEKINQSAQVTYDLLENLLEWARTQTHMISIHPLYLSVSMLIIDAITFFSNQISFKNISIKYDKALKYEIFADCAMMSTVIRNILGNAIKFTNHDGLIQIIVEKDENYCYIRIEDNGVGISSENILKLFKIDTTFSTNGVNGEKGTGLGLIIASDFVRMNKGFIHVESETGKGTAFTVQIPIKGL